MTGSTSSGGAAPRRGHRGPRWQWVRVSGPSMVPTLRTGDRLLVRHRASIRSGDVVLAQFADLPGQWVVKRAVRPDGTRWVVASDNAYAAGDSAVHGPARVVARAVLRVRGRRIGRVPAAPDPAL